ncbi:MAG: helix-turn-helix domain-containing protein [Bacteroidetes bacterium]|nr:helix-turn-helix domain-containing protein [Bacteroidota bacterium]
MIKITDNRSSCPISTALEIIGDQWSLILIRNLFMQQTTFSEFREGPEKISTNILTDRLKRLKKFQIIDFVTHPNNKKVKMYFLKDAGIDLYPMIYELSIWGKKYFDMEFHPVAIDSFKAAEGRDATELIAEISEEYKSFRDQFLQKQEVSL